MKTFKKSYILLSLFVLRTFLQGFSTENPASQILGIKKTFPGWRILHKTTEYP